MNEFDERSFHENSSPQNNKLVLLGFQLSCNPRTHMTSDQSLQKLISLSQTGTKSVENDIS